MIRLLAFILLTTILTCTGAISTADSPSPEFEGTVWMLKHIGSRDIPNSPTQPFIKFEAGRFQGFGGCNRFSGAYDREKDAIRIKQILATKMYCENIDTEQNYLTHLQRGNRFLIRTDKMLISEKDQQLLLFKSKKD